MAIESLLNKLLQNFGRCTVVVGLQRRTNIQPTGIEECLAVKPEKLFSPLVGIDKVFSAYVQHDDCFGGMLDQRTIVCLTDS